MSNALTDNYTDIANAIRTRFSLDEKISPLEFGNKIDSNIAIIALEEGFMFQTAIGRIYQSVANAIRSLDKRLTDPIYPPDMPNRILAIPSGLTTVTTEYTDYIYYTEYELSEGNYVFTVTVDMDEHFTIPSEIFDVSYSLHGDYSKATSLSGNRVEITYTAAKSDLDTTLDNLGISIDEFMSSNLSCAVSMTYSYYREG